MVAHRIARLIKALIVTTCFLQGFTAQAQLSAALRYKTKHADTTSTGSFEADYVYPTIALNNASVNVANRATLDEAPIDFAENHLTDRQERKKLMGYLKELSANNAQINYNQARVKVYYKLANVFARLRLYPLAMKCFFKTMQYREGELPVKNQPIPVALNDTAADTSGQGVSIGNNYLAINAKDDSLFVNDANLPVANKSTEKSKAINYQRIINTFNDGKKAAAYALLFHVKQPVAGKPKVFKLTNTGHTFITLIKYNTDSTSVSISFGFYPQKDNLFSATPLDPSCSGTFKNDNAHQWDEVMGKFISKRRFEKILALTKSYDGVEYHLSKNNCTDFALKAAAFAGFGVTNSKDSWPLGHGNNPGTTGQSIIDGKVHNSESVENLFVDYQIK
ncbi:hypothetical protein [Mucilaginibacter flavus]|uniref:hypothetical protein n=1 Tax=Mucilaginibacter flavus TaxID=931504 RepID=UPI0025B55EE9|nr:hypothetical protein [Mucilaginibacter flavus]MDN3584898.1 hypothetical protein [Mucilaginibacter flavus]